MVVRHGWHGLLHRMAGAELLGLQCPGDVLAGKRLAHMLTAVTVDHVDVAGRELARGVDDVLEQRAPRDGLQDLGQVRLHALALAGGQDDDGNGH